MHLTLKIGSRSPKPYHFLALSKLSSHASLVRIYQLVLEKVCRKARFDNSDSTSKKFGNLENKVKVTKI